MKVYKKDSPRFLLLLHGKIAFQNPFYLKQNLRVGSVDDGGAFELLSGEADLLGKDERVGSHEGGRSSER